MPTKMIVKMIRIIVLCFSVMFSSQVMAQKKMVKKTEKQPISAKKIIKPTGKSTTKSIKKEIKKPELNLPKINESIPLLIPNKKDGLFGYISQERKVIIPHRYKNVGFFYEDCNLLNSKNEEARKFGTNEYASVRLNDVDYRIDQWGKIAYKYKPEDLERCSPEFKSQRYNAYVLNGFYGIVEREKFNNEQDVSQYQIYPQFQYLHIMEGDDIDNPMIIATHNDLFGVIDKTGKVIIPFVYKDIKRNFSWKIGKLFEVTNDGVNYYFVDIKNQSY